MSHLLSALTGKQAVRLWKDYRLVQKTSKKQLHYCLLRFYIGDYSSVVVGTGKSPHSAGAAALRAFIDFCESIGAVWRDTDVEVAEYEPSEEELAQWRAQDDQWWQNLPVIRQV